MDGSLLAPLMNSSRDSLPAGRRTGKTGVSQCSLCATLGRTHGQLLGRGSLLGSESRALQKRDAVQAPCTLKAFLGKPVWLSLITGGTSPRIQIWEGPRFEADPAFWQPVPWGNLGLASVAVKQNKSIPRSKAVWERLSETGFHGRLYCRTCQSLGGLSLGR